MLLVVVLKRMCQSMIREGSGGSGRLWTDTTCLSLCKFTRGLQTRLNLDAVRWRIPAWSPPSRLTCTTRNQQRSPAHQQQATRTHLRFISLPHEISFNGVALHMTPPTNKPNATKAWMMIWVQRRVSSSISRLERSTERTSTGSGLPSVLGISIPAAFASPRAVGDGEWSRKVSERAEDARWVGANAPSQAE